MPVITICQQSMKRQSDMQEKTTDVRCEWSELETLDLKQQRFICFFARFRLLLLQSIPKCTCWIPLEGLADEGPRRLQKVPFRRCTEIMACTILHLSILAVYIHTYLMHLNACTIAINFHWPFQGPSFNWRNLFHTLLDLVTEGKGMLTCSVLSLWSLLNMFQIYIHDNFIRFLPKIYQSRLHKLSSCQAKMPLSNCWPVWMQTISTPKTGADWFTCRQDRWTIEVQNTKRDQRMKMSDKCSCTLHHAMNAHAHVMLISPPRVSKCVSIYKYTYTVYIYTHTVCCKWVCYGVELSPLSCCVTCLNFTHLNCASKRARADRHIRRFTKVLCSIAYPSIPKHVPIASKYSAGKSHGQGANSWCSISGQWRYSYQGKVFEFTSSGARDIVWESCLPSVNLPVSFALHMFAKSKSFEQQICPYLVGT